MAYFVHRKDTTAVTDTNQTEGPERAQPLRNQRNHQTDKGPGTRVQEQKPWVRVREAGFRSVRT